MINSHEKPRHRALTIILLFMAGLRLIAFRQDAPRSISNGLYTSSQAERGEALYRQACAGCHGDTLAGEGQAPALAGSDFNEHWNGMSLGDLLEKIQTTMPADRPGQLSKDQNAQILAFILKSNRFPSGTEDLAADGEALKGVRFDAPKTVK